MFKDAFLIAVFQKEPKAHDLIEEKSMMRELVDTLNNSQSDFLIQFAQYLSKQCELPPSTIFKVVKGLLSHPQSSSVLGTRILKLWLLFSIYDTMAIIKSKQEKKRALVCRAFSEFAFAGSTLTELVSVCWKAAGQKIQEVSEVVEEVASGRDVSALFPQQVLQINPEDIQVSLKNNSSELLKDLVADYKLFPETSFERFLQREMIIAYVSTKSEDSDEVLRILPQFKGFKSQVKGIREAYSNVNGFANSIVEQKMEKILEASKEQLFELLCQLKAVLMSVDVFQLQRLVQKTKGAEKCIEGKDVILFIGNTGSGKSTSILKFLGYTLRKGTYKGLNTLVPVQKMQKQHMTFVTSPQNKSCTRYMNAVSVPKSMYPKKGSSKDSSLVLADSPGFGDSAGPEVDIANGIGMINSLHEAQTVRVVIILAEELKGLRMAGVITICEIISNLFQDLEPILKSIRVLFNKIPTDQIQEIPKLLKNKLKNLSLSERGNQKLKTILKQIERQSEDRANFIDPIKSNFQKIFHSILELEPISQVSCFKYDFTQKTKSAITKFSNDQRNKGQKFLHTKVEETQFRLTILSKLKGILQENSSVEENYDLLAKAIEEKSSSQFTEYENQMKKIIYGKSTPESLSKLQQRGIKLKKMHELFKEFSDTKVMTVEKVQSLQQTLKTKLIELSKSKKIQQITKQNICAVNNLSAAFKQEKFKKTFIENLYKQYQETVSNLEGQLRHKQFEQMKPNFDKSKALSNILGQLQKKNEKTSSVSKITKKEKAMKEALSKEFESALVEIGSLKSNKRKIEEKFVQTVKGRIKAAKQITALNYLDKNNTFVERLQAQIKGIQFLCKKTINELQTPNLSMEGQIGKKQFRIDDYKGKSKQIELLMTIQNFEATLGDDLRFCRQNIAKKHQQNSQTLQKYISTLRDSKNSEEIYKKIDFIYKAVAAFRQFHDIIEDEKRNNQIFDKLQSQFNRFLQVELSSLKSINIKISQLTPENTAKIIHLNKKIGAYERMSVLGPLIEQRVKQLKEGLNERIKLPFKQYLSSLVDLMKSENSEVLSHREQQHKKKRVSEIQTPKNQQMLEMKVEVEEKIKKSQKPKKGANNYKYLPYTIQRLQKLSQFFFKLEETEDFHHLQSQREIQQVCQELQAICSSIKEEVVIFIRSQFDYRTHPFYLTQLVKTLLHISSKNSACNFISKLVSFETSQHLQNIKNKLVKIKDKLSDRTKTSSNKAGDLQEILQACIFYAQIEHEYQIIGQNRSFGFEILRAKSQQKFIGYIKDDQQKLKMLLKSKPSSINFEQIATLYNKFCSLKNQQTKKDLIIFQFRIKQESLIKQLRDLSDELQSPELANKVKINKLLQAFKEAFTLQRQLKVLYTKEGDRKQIKIKQQTIQSVGEQILKHYQHSIESIMYLLMKQSNIPKVTEQLKLFISLQNTLLQIYTTNHWTKVHQKSKIQKPKQQAYFEKIVSQKGNEVKKQIMENPFIDELQKRKAKDHTRIKSLFACLKKGKEQQLQSKYHVFTTDYSIDGNFSNYYKNTSEQHKKQLQYNIQKYFQTLYHSYALQFNKSKDTAENIKAKIVEANNNLPGEFRLRFKQKFEKKVRDLQSQSLNSMQEMSQKLKKNAKSIDKFFEQSKKALQNNNKQLHSKWVKQLNEILSQLSENNQNLQQKIPFLTDYFLTSFRQHSSYLLKEDSKMLEVLRVNFIHQLNSLKQVIKRIFIELIEFFKHPAKNKIENSKDQAENILKVYQFYSKIGHYDQLVRTKQDYNKFMSLCAQNLNECINAYNANISKKPQYKLDSKQQFDPRNMNNLKEYMAKLHQTAETIVVIAQIKSLLQKDYRESRIQQIKQYKSIVLQFESQLQQIKTFVKNFEFYGDLKRNMTPKEIQQDLQKLNNYYKILQQKQDELVQMLYLGNKKNKYIFHQIKNVFQTKFDSYVDDAIKQINKSFERKGGESAEKVNLLMGQLQVMNRGKQYSFIKKQKIKDQLQRVNKVIKEQFKGVSSRCKNLLKESQKNFKKFSDDLKKITAQEQKQMKKIEQQMKQALQSKMQELNKKIQQQISKQSDQKKKQDLGRQLLTQKNNIKNEAQQEKNKKIEEIKKKTSEKKKQLAREVEEKAASFSDSMIIYQKALIDIVYKGDDSKEQFQKIVEEIKKGGPKFIEIVQNNLAESDDPRSIGKLILSEQQIFAKFKIQAINRLIKGQDIKYVLEHLKKLSISGRENMKNSQLSSIEQCYKTFLLIYEKQKSKYVQDPTENTIISLANPLKTLGIKIKEEFYGNNNSMKNRQKKIHLLAGIFALWAIMKSEIDEETLNVIFTIEPHPTQITTLFLLLGICQPDERIANRLAQVGTGQGKSIVLAGLCSYLALVGFKIRCACYSLYLSGRDSQSFRELFERLGVQNDIKYSTFNQLCEDILNSGGKNLKKQVQGMIVTQGVLNSIFEAFGQNFISLKKNKSKQVRTILVIDEVDVFFEDSFFGKTYCPAISLKGEEVSKVLHQVWNLVQAKGAASTPSSIIQSQPFKNLLNKYPTLSAILQNQVHGMISGALNYKHDYIIDESKLIYKDGDAISDKINYGYKTVFANIFQFNNSRVSQLNLDNSLQISLMVAQFSYAELPSYFQNILGVTGTLQVLPNFKKRLLKDRYQINEQYVIPSAFGINKKRIEKYVIVPQASYEQTIISKINQVKDNRPIIIFFKGPRQLNQFACSPHYLPYMGRSYTLTECHDASTRDSRVVKATNPNNITLMSSVFGRGTDFIILDQTIKQKGGLHVIEAFLPHEQSQQIQIKGRTARQNGKGSVDCIFIQGRLEQIDKQLITTTKNQPSEKIHSQIFKARQAKIQKSSQTTNQMLAVADKQHKEVFQIFTKSQLSQKILVEYVFKLNKYPLLTKSVIKTILCIDVTGSMSFALQKTLQIIGIAFDRSYKVFEDQRVTATVQVKIKTYRNYDCSYDKILQGTAFQSTPARLKTFLQTTRAQAGYGYHQAVQVAFQSMNKEDAISQVILIGDAAPNTKQEVIQKRQMRGQAYWIQNGFPSTHIDKQLEILKKFGCPVHSFYLNNGEGFKQISAQTGGQASLFQINSPNITELFTAFVVKNILRLAQKQVGNANLVETYRKMYGS